MKCFVVVSGCYSDFGFHAVYLDRTDAEAAITHANIGRVEDTFGSHYSIDECDLNPGVLEMKAGRKAFWINMDKDGNATQHCSCALPCNDDFTVRPAYQRPHGSAGWECFGTVMATDMQHAVKIMNEKRTQWIATYGLEKATP